MDPIDATHVDGDDPSTAAAPAVPPSPSTVPADAPAPAGQPPEGTIDLTDGAGEAAPPDAGVPNQPDTTDAPAMASDDESSAADAEPAEVNAAEPVHDNAAEGEPAPTDEPEPTVAGTVAEAETEAAPAAADEPAPAPAPGAAATPADAPPAEQPPASEQPAPGAPPGPHIPDGLRSGQIVSGTVSEVSSDEVVLQLEDGTTGVIGRRHLTANGQQDPTEVVTVGETVEAAVLVRDDPKGRVVLSRAWAQKQRAWEAVEAAHRARRPLTGTVTGQVKGGLVVDVGTRAFLPASHVDLHHVDDLSTLVGQPIEALVTEADRANDKVVLSRRNLLRSQQRSKASEFAASLEAGQVHRGRVALITDFGAFVEIGGVRGLVHLSELAWSRVGRASDVVSPGDEVDVKVLAVKPGKKLSLSIRALSPDPLIDLSEGDVVTGVVTRLVDYGAFVRVGEGAEGLVHVTELAEYRVHAPEEVVTPGDEVLVKVIRLDRKRRRLDLSVTQAVLS